MSSVCMIQYWGISCSRWVLSVWYSIEESPVRDWVVSVWYGIEESPVRDEFLSVWYSIEWYINEYIDWYRLCIIAESQHEFYLYDTDLREHIGVRHLLHIYGRQILASFYSIILWISLYLNVVSKVSSCRATLYKMKLAKLYQKQFNMYAELLQEFCMEYDLI